MITIPQRKEDVQVDYHSRREKELPALNVKCYKQAEWTAERIQEHFGCSKVAAEKAVETVYECMVEQFWEQDAPELLNHVMFGDEGGYRPAGLKKSPYEVYAEGRMGGWLVVEGLPPVSDWNGPMFQRWRKFARLIGETIQYNLTFDAARELIEANEWCPKEATVDGYARDAQLIPAGRLVDAALAIHCEMNGKEWSPDTLDRIADHLRNAGLGLAEPEDL